MTVDFLVNGSSLESMKMETSNQFPLKAYIEMRISLLSGKLLLLSNGTRNAKSILDNGT
jgi:hypothetical protein